MVEELKEKRAEVEERSGEVEWGRVRGGGGNVE